MKSQSTYADID